MAGKAIDGTPIGARSSGHLFEKATPPSPPEARATRFTLTGTVQVEFDVLLHDADGVTRHVTVRVDFPEEVRSMLEASTWTHGTTILEALARLGAAFLERMPVASLTGEYADGKTYRNPATLQLPLSYLRSKLASAVATES